MNYDCLKNYGKFVRNTAHHISSYDDIYKAALELPYDMRAYLLQSTFAFTEVIATIEHSPETVSKVIDKYVMSPEIDQLIVNNSVFDKSMEFDFIEHDCGAFWGIIQNIKLDVTALRVIAHPSEHSKECVVTALKDIAARIKPTPENHAAYTWSYTTLISEFQKNQEAHKKEIQEDKKYIIIAEKQLFEIYNFLKESKEISRDIEYETFKRVIESADASLIKPKTKWKYNAALSLARECIKDSSLEWTREICTSLKIGSNGLTQNIKKMSEWYIELEKRFKMAT